MKIGSKRRTFYVCPHCKEEHETRKEAEECRKQVLPKEAKRGRMVIDSRQAVWELGEENEFRVTLCRVDEALWLQGRTAKDSRVERVRHVPRISCSGYKSYRMFTDQDVQKELSSLRRRIKIGERLLKRFTKGTK